MNQILIITRVNNGDEFHEWFSAPEMANVHEKHNSNANCYLDIYNGNQLDFGNVAFEGNVTNKFRADAQKKILLGHRFELRGNTHFFVSYSSSATHYYGELKSLIINAAVNGGADIDTLYKRVDGDPRLEAQLTLLHNCLAPVTTPGDLNSPEYSPLIDEDKTHFNNFKNDSKKGYEPFDKEKNYQTSLTALRDALLA